jgi:lysophospholipase L1-like esterase
MSKSSLSLSKRLIAVCLLLGMGLVLGAVLLEVSVRMFFPVSDFFWQWDSAIGMKLIPGKRGRAIQRGIFDTQIDVNSVGFRDREHAVEKPAGTRRVVLLGDSFLEAIQVPFEGSITPQLESRLRARTGPTELINLGVSGTGTAREYLALREYGLRYKPDLVLMFFVGNDVSDNSRRLQGLPYIPYPRITADGDLARDESGRPQFTPFADQTSNLSAVTAVFRNHSKAYRFLREAVDNSPGLNRLLYKLRLVSTPPETVNAPASDNFGFYEIYRVEPKPAWAEAWHLTEQMMLAARDLAAANQAKFGVVLIPAFWEVDSQRWNEALTQLPAMRKTRLDLELPSRRLTNFLKAHDVPVFDLLPEFRAHAAGSPPLYLRSDAHWTVNGHKLAADLLADPVAALLGAEKQPLVSASQD